jgi:hypothetical protein
MANQLTQLVVHNKQFQNTPTITTDAYTAADSLGGLITINSAVPIGGFAYLESILISDLASNDTSIDVVFFNDNPSASTITDNTAIDVHDDDIDKIFLVKNMPAANYVSFADNSVGFVGNIVSPIIMIPTNTTLYVAMVERGTPTRAVGDITLTLNISWVGE